MLDAVTSLLGSERFMPHGMCYLWEPPLVHLHLWSDVVIGVAYYLIPPALIWFVLRARHQDDPSERPTLPFGRVFVAFGVFIVACGTTHFFAAWNIFTPTYWLAGGVKALTAGASIATALALPPLIPRALETLRAARESERRREALARAHTELETLYGQLRDAERVRTDFFANVSHELRTPLSLILGPAEQLAARTDLDEQGRRDAQVVLANARSLAGQVEDLLDLARMDGSGAAVHREPADLAALLRAVAGEFAAVTRGRGIDFRIDAPEAIHAHVDVHKIARVVRNLLANAFKFTPVGGTIRCTLMAEHDEAGRDDVVVTVADSGPGVPPEERGRVFDRFWRSARSTQQHEGVGLGLAIAREFVALHGGSVAVGEAREGGARFVVRLPARPATAIEDAAGAGAPDASGTVPALGERDATARAATRAADAQGPRTTSEGEGTPYAGATPRATPATRDVAGRPHVLLVEDHADLRRHLAELLDEDYRVTEAGDGEAALAAARAEPPDLVVTDLMMPGVAGDELARRLRAHPATADTPILVLTARADEQMKTGLLGTWVEDYVPKPVSAAELRARIRNLVSIKRSRDVLRDELRSTEADLEKLVREARARRSDLARALEDRELLVKEIHHRVKGNLQTVVSLLRLQAARAVDEETRQVLATTETRVRALAILHAHLYQEEDLGVVDLVAYLGRLLAEIATAHGLEGRPPVLRTEREPVWLDTDLAVPCGLIVHELVTNAIRHAYAGDPPPRPYGGEPEHAGRGAGPVDVTLEAADGALALSVHDAGVGLPEDASGIGSEIVRALARQLDGELRIESRPGDTTVAVRFPWAGRPSA